MPVPQLHLGTAVMTVLHVLHRTATMAYTDRIRPECTQTMEYTDVQTGRTLLNVYNVVHTLAETPLLAAWTQMHTTYSTDSVDRSNVVTCRTVMTSPDSYARNTGNTRLYRHCSACCTPLCTCSTPSTLDHPVQ